MWRALTVARIALLAGCIPGHLIEGVKDRDGDGYYGLGWDGDDCDDWEQSVHPGAPEVCGDGIDNNCDGVVDDDGLDAGVWFLDADGDEFGDAAQAVTACAPPEGYVDNAADCDDDDDGAFPGADEYCDDMDNDCDTDVDENAVDAPTWYFDDDGDDYGVSSPTQVGCDQPAGYAAVAGDCDDSLAAVNPGAQFRP